VLGHWTELDDPLGARPGSALGLSIPVQLGELERVQLDVADAGRREQGSHPAHVLGRERAAERVNHLGRDASRRHHRFL
jgi:hypothetical protein